MMQALAIVCVIVAAGLAIWMGQSWRKTRAEASAIAAPQPTPLPEVLPSIAGSAPDWYAVLPGKHLLQHCKVSETLEQIQRQTRLSDAVFERDLGAALRTYAEFVQLAPASEAHHHAHIGGLIAHTLEVILSALVLRNGKLLPLNAKTEIIDAQRDHWTYAVFLGALLHDIGKIMTDLRIEVRDSPKSPTRPWLPFSGPMTASYAKEYRIGFAPKSQRDYLAHKRLSLVLLQAIVPANALAFLGRENSVLDALTSYLVEDGEKTEGTAALATIIKMADQRSVAFNLSHGPRNQLSTATAVPLVEILMRAMRDILRQGTALPLNRSGAAGWVFDGAIWFVAKRLADVVREHIQKTAPDESIPGANKNDRLFDTWQDYGVIDVTANGRAVWNVVIEGPDYSHQLGVLKFPLNRLFDDVAHHPTAMQGRVQVIDQVTAPIVAPATDAVISETDERKSETTGTNSAIQEEKAFQEELGAPAHVSEEDPDVDDLPPMPELVSAPPPPPAPSRKNAKSSRQGRNQEHEADFNENWIAPEMPAARLSPPAPETAPASTPISSSGVPKPRRPTQSAEKLLKGLGLTPPTVSARSSKQAASATADLHGGPSAELLDPADDVSRRQQRVTTNSSPAPSLAKQPKIAPVLADGNRLSSETAATPAPTETRAVLKQVAASGTSGPVSPFAQPPKLKTDVEPDPLAISFMGWLQQGLASGNLLYNEVNAPVHFVQGGMALVSPRIFKEYASEHGKAAEIVQKKVIDAGWNLKGPTGNILHFATVKKGNVRVGKLAAVVIQFPERWIQPLPPANHCIVPFDMALDPAAGVAESRSKP